MPLVITVYTNNDINTWEHHIELIHGDIDSYSKLYCYAILVSVL